MSLMNKTAMGLGAADPSAVNFTVSSPTGTVLASGGATNPAVCTDTNGNVVDCSDPTAVNCTPLAACDPNVAWLGNSQASATGAGYAASTGTTSTTAIALAAMLAAVLLIGVTR
jgi:hypothetical protein